MTDGGQTQRLAVMYALIKQIKEEMKCEEHLRRQAWKVPSCRLVVEMADSQRGDEEDADASAIISLEGVYFCLKHKGDRLLLDDSSSLF